MILLLLFTLACAGLMRLGFWQLERADLKQTRFDTYLAARAAPPVDFSELYADAPPGDHVWRSTKVHGHYLDFDVLLDNRVLNGQTGYEVLSPLALEDGRHVLVNRGWVALPGSRDTLPPLRRVAGKVTLQGRLGDVPVVGVRLNAAAGAAERLATGVVRVQRVDLARVGELVQRDLWPGVIYLDADQPGALTVAWPDPGSGAERHRAYALQWFLMAAVLAAIGLWQWRRTRTHG